MGRIQPGDFVQAEFRSESTGESEWMWVKVDSVDNKQRMVFGKLDSHPVVNIDLQLGMKLAVSYENVREHMKESEFQQQ